MDNKYSLRSIDQKFANRGDDSHSKGYSTRRSARTMRQSVRSPVKQTELKPKDKLLKKKSLKGRELVELYKRFSKSRKTKKFLETVFGSQLNDVDNIIYLFTDKSKPGQGHELLRKNKILSGYDNVQVIETERTNPEGCISCDKDDCESLRGTLRKTQRDWIGIGSPILAINEEIYIRFIRDREGLDTLDKIYGVIHSLSSQTCAETEEEDEQLLGNQYWTLGCTMKAENDNIIVTSYHPIYKPIAAGAKFRLFTEVVEKGETSVKQLNLSCIGKDGKDWGGGYRKNKCDILAFRAHPDIESLLKTRLKFSCDDNKEWNIKLDIFPGDIPTGTKVIKRGAVTGVTFGKVISSFVTSYSNTPQDCFAVSSTKDALGNTVLFSRPGDSGSMVLEVKPVQQHGENIQAYGLIWGKLWKQGIFNPETGQWDKNATVCSRMDINLNALRKYRNAQFPN